jgi:hypothetical protein
MLSGYAQRITRNGTETTGKEKMAKLIIDNRSDLDDALAVEMVKKVIEDGRISNGGTQYCYHTTFTGRDGRRFGVISTLNKSSDRFVVVNE